MARKIIKNKKKIAFVASGGAVKAACFHIGVMLAMQRFGFTFMGGVKKDGEERKPKSGEVSVYVGSSAGSFITSMIAGGFTPEQLYNSLSSEDPNHTKIPRPISYTDIMGNNVFSNVNSFMSSLTKVISNRDFSLEGILQSVLGFNGLFSTSGVGKYLKDNLPCDKFSDLAPELYIVTTELDNPNRIIMAPRVLEKPSLPCDFETNISIHEAAVGSMSLPFIYGPHKMKIKGKDKYIFDGEVRHTLSSHLAKDAGADLIITSYTHQPYHFNPEYGSLIKYGLPIILIQTIYQVIESKIVEAKHRHETKHMIYKDVKDFFINKGLPKDAMNELLELLEKKLNFSHDVDYIYISPEPTDSRMFFENHFNLSPKSMGKILRSGFKSSYHVLSNYKFMFENNEVEIELK